MQLETTQAHLQRTGRLVHRRCVRRPARPRAGAVTRLAGLGALHPMRPHRVAPPLVRTNPVRHRRRRLRPSPRRSTDPHPGRRRHRHPTRRMALARRRTRPLHGPPRLHRRRHRMGRPPHRRRISQRVIDALRRQAVRSVGQLAPSSNASVVDSPRWASIWARRSATTFCCAQARRQLLAGKRRLFSDSIAGVMPVLTHPCVHELPRMFSASRSRRVEPSVLRRGDDVGLL